ncbi:MAG: ABC transporter ATP-binding protein [Sphaerochaeta sp.]
MIELSNVAFTYRNAESGSLDGIDVNIREGECAVIAGDSGCGKTTVIRTINGLVPHFYEGALSGDICVDGADPSQQEIYETARIVGSVFQNPRTQFFNVDTTSEVAFACENQGLPEAEIIKRMNAVVARMGIEGLMNRSIFELSGGEKQKIACAEVAMTDSRVIVLDEPSSNLDGASIEELKRVLLQWKQEGRTLIIAEHRLYYLRELADRMLVMDGGRIAGQYLSADIRHMGFEQTQRLGLRPFSLDELFAIRLDDMRMTAADSPAPSFSDTPTSGGIVLERFFYRYKDKEHGISLDDVRLPAGRVIAVIGHNGAGKTTFANCFCGLAKSFKGIVEFEGSTLAGKHRLRRSYLVLQEAGHQLFTDSVEKEILLSMSDERGRNRLGEEERRNRLEEILERLNLVSLRKRHPLSLSGGQKQRVAIASALAADKDFILFDEPTSGLDLRHMREVAGSIRKLRELGKTVFVITHDLELVMECCDHVLHLEKGREYANYELNDGTKRRLLDVLSNEILENFG